MQPLSLGALAFLPASIQVTKPAGMPALPVTLMSKSFPLERRPIGMGAVQAGVDVIAAVKAAGLVDTLNGPDTVVAMLDYRTGKMLYDVRDDLSRSQGATEPGTPSTEPSPGGTAASTSPSPAP